jgi:hypothetical protein
VQEPDAARSATDRLRDDLRAVLPSWITARVLVVVAWVLAIGVIEHWVPGARTTHQQVGLLAWDGGFYRDIAVIGYGGITPEALRFFPLHALAGRVLSVFTLGNTELALVLVANAAALVAGVLVRRLVLLERDGDEAAAERAVWLLNLFPASFVLVWAYAEGLFVALAVGTFLAARRGRFALAGGLAFAAALTRPVGVFLAAALAVEAWRTWSDADIGGRVARVTAVLAPVAGLGCYLGWVGRTFGDPMLPFTVQDKLRTTMDPVRRLAHGLADMVGSARFDDGLHVPFVLAFLVLLVVLARRWPASYTVYAALVLLAAISAGNFNSVERYALNAFPLLFALADLTHTPRRERLALAVCGNGLVALCALAWLAVFVP